MRESTFSPSQGLSIWPMHSPFEALPPEGRYASDYRELIITIIVPVVFMARYIMVSEPTPFNAPSNDVACLKTIKYKRHKNNRYVGGFMYPSAVVWCCCV